MWSLDSYKNNVNQFASIINHNIMNEIQPNHLALYCTEQPQPQPSIQESEQNIVMIQKNLRACIDRRKLMQRVKKLRRRKNIIQELIDTEENYIRDLGFIVSDFKMRLLSTRIIDEEQCNYLFANVDEIRKLHEDFFTTLFNQFLGYHHYQVIFADILKSILFFRIYVEYLNNFPQACELIEHLKEHNTAFRNFLVTIINAPKYRSLNIQDFLVKPVQRLPKYVLLMKEILKNTQPEHPDYRNIQKALQKFQEVNCSNNDKLTEISNNYRLSEIAQSLKLPEEIIAPGVEFVLEDCVQILNLEQNLVISNCYMYLLTNALIVSRHYGSNHNTSTVSSGRKTQIVDRRSKVRSSQRTSSLNNYSGFKERLEVIVPIKHSTSLFAGQNMSFYKNALTIQSVQGETCTFICQNEEDLAELQGKLKKQIDRAMNETKNKLQNMMNRDIKNEVFLKDVAMLQLVPEVRVLGTTERNDKMLKYTIYIVEVKVKMVRQKIFVRFSELLEVEKFIELKYRDRFTLKQALVTSSWINNHHQKTIQERKMNIQRFLKELLSKPDVIMNGVEILLQLGLPYDFYELPKKLTSMKTHEDFLKRSSFAGRSSIYRGILGRSSIAPSRRATEQHNRISNYRLSIFQQQKIEQQEQEQQLDELEQLQSQQHQSFINQNPKSSNGNLSQNFLKLTIQDILKANQIDLGHYTRYSENLDQSSEFSQQSISMLILIPSIPQFFHKSPHESSMNKQKLGHGHGFRQLSIKCKKWHRIQSVVSQIAKLINLKYFKDFRLFLEKDYSHRVVDDDQLVHKVAAEAHKSSSSLIFRKKIFIDSATEEKEMKLDRQRLKIVASQIIHQINKGKYMLTYQQYLKFASLSALISQLSVFHPHQDRTFKKNKVDIRAPISDARLRVLAKQAKEIILPKYSTLSQPDQIWISDFIKTYKIILGKLQSIATANQATATRRQSSILPNIENVQSFMECLSPTKRAGLPTESSLRYLSLLSIVKQIEKAQPELFGSSSFPVQISEQFMEHLSKMDEEQQGSYNLSNNSTSDEENRNCWLQIRHNKAFLTSIGLTKILIDIPYSNLQGIQTYATSIVLSLKNMSLSRIKLKTTGSYYIQQILIYYRNYNRVYQQMCQDPDLCESIISVTKEQQVHIELEEAEDYIV